MEGVIAKKSELKKKLPATSEEEVISVSPAAEKRPSAPPLDQQVVTCEVHKEPKVARFTTRSSRTPSSSALDRN